MNIQQTASTPKLVTMIPADPQMTERDIRNKHLRIAPYCRVSTDKKEQLSSYEAQIEYYTEKINANPDWTLVRLYADEGITGTSAKKRKAFLQMIRDCERGKIDLVITKSVSRFCRNTLDGLNYVRRLKRHGVGVYFEKENVNTLFMDNEMILTFMMSQAQAESESLSGNVRWGHRKNFKDGKVYYHCKNFLGYRWGADGQPEIDPEQAAIVRRIFSRFLLGHSVRQITTDLMADGIKTATGKTVWHDSVVQKMLCNEKYIGDSLVQKRYTPEDLPLRQKRNNGELSQYYIQNSHPAIISRETFETVQQLLNRRRKRHPPSVEMQQTPLRSTMQCALCGSYFHKHKSNGENCWFCALHRKSKDLCPMPNIREQEILMAFLSMYNKLLDNIDILSTMMSQLLELQAKSVCSRPDIMDLNEKISALVTQNHSLSRLQAKGCIDSAIFIERSNRNNKLIEELRQELRQRQEPDDTSSAIEGTRLLLDLLEGAKPMLEFDTSIFQSMVKQITVYQEKFCFQLANGLVLEEMRAQS